jgi:hypothetical protein
VERFGTGSNGRQDFGKQALGIPAERLRRLDGDRGEAL